MDAAPLASAPEARVTPRTAGTIAPARLDRILQAAGDWLLHHQTAIRTVQWLIVGLYLMLLIAPALLPLPPRAAHIWNNATLFAQFAFWGIWWPFVLLSMVLAGRLWCGLLCPEGTVTEAVSGWGKGRAVPRWITWKGWPFTAFVCTTVYAQMVSVYQYPKPAVIVLGGSTLAALAVGALYGRRKRVWCRYLCPVNGVFGLLAKLAPVHFRVDREAWLRSPKPGVRAAAALNCAPLVPVRTMQGAALCHMCGRCSGFRGAVVLAHRSPAHEIVHVAGQHSRPWETVLILFGLMGLAPGAFLWTSSALFVSVKQMLAAWLAGRGVIWPLEPVLPWWILTNYPSQSDVLTPLDGVVLIGYLAGISLVIGGCVAACLAAATRALGPWSWPRFHHLAQSLIPLAGCGVFLGLSALTVTMLHAEGMPLGFVDLLRGALLAGAALWSLSLGWRIAELHAVRPIRQIAALPAFALAAVTGSVSWIILFRLC